MQREKGKRGEREVARIVRELLGVAAQRRVRQHEGDSDIVGVAGWCIEVKLWARATQAMVDQAWLQAIEQADREKARPVLFWRVARQDWRCRFPLSAVAVDATHCSWLESEPGTWALVAMRHGCGVQSARDPQQGRLQ